MAWADFWPAWEIDGEEHPILIIQKDDNGEVAILPLTTKPELSEAYVSVSKRHYPSAFKPNGILSVDETVICLADGKRQPAMIWGRPHQNEIHFPNKTVKLRRIIKLSREDWTALRQAILDETQDMSRRGFFD